MLPNPVPVGGAAFPGGTGGADPAVPPAAGLGGGLCPDCNVTITAAGTVDSEKVGIDSWYISTKDSVSNPIAGCGVIQPVPAGAPASTYNDVNCDT